MCGRKVQPKGGPVTPISRAFVDLYPVRFEVYICNKKNPLPHPMPSTETKPDKVGLLVLRTSSVLSCPVLSCPVLFFASPVYSLISPFSYFCSFLFLPISFLCSVQFHINLFLISFSYHSIILLFHPNLFYFILFCTKLLLPSPLLPFPHLSFPLLPSPLHFSPLLSFPLLSSPNLSSSLLSPPFLSCFSLIFNYLPYLTFQFLCFSSISLFIFFFVTCLLS